MKRIGVGELAVETQLLHPPILGFTNLFQRVM